MQSDDQHFQSIVRLNFQFETGGTFPVDLIKDQLIQNYPGSYFDSLLSSRWNQTGENESTIFVPSTVYNRSIDCLKFRKNIVPLLLKENITISNAIKNESFIDFYLGNPRWIIRELLSSPSNFETTKDAALALNWLFDCEDFDAVQRRIDKWEPLVDQLKIVFAQKDLNDENCEMFAKYLLFSTMISIKNDSTRLIDPFDICCLKKLSKQNTPLRHVVQNDATMTKNVNFVTTLSEFQTNFIEMCPFLNEIEWRNICVAGGSVINCLTNNFYDTRDVDFFVCSNDVSTFSNLLLTIEKWAKNQQREITFIGKCSVVTILIQGCSYPFQLILTDHNSFVDLVCGFEADVNQCFYDGAGVHCSESCIFSLATKTVHHIKPTKYCRITRLLEKGFSISSIVDKHVFDSSCGSFFNHFENTKMSFDLRINHSCQNQGHENCDCIIKSDELLKLFSTYDQWTKKKAQECAIFNNFLSSDLNETSYSALLNLGQIYKSVEKLLNQLSYIPITTSDYIEQRIKYRDVSEINNLKDLIISDPRGYNKIVDKNDNIFIFFLKNVQIGSIDSSVDSKFYKVLIDESSILVQNIKQLEKLAYYHSKVTCPFRSKVSEGAFYFKVGLDTNIFSEVPNIGDRINAIILAQRIISGRGYLGSFNASVRFIAITLCKLPG